MLTGQHNTDRRTVMRDWQRRIVRDAHVTDKDLLEMYIPWAARWWYGPDVVEGWLMEVRAEFKRQMERERFERSMKRQARLRKLKRAAGD